MDAFPICVAAGELQAGSYLLRVRVHEDLRLSFGQFKKGKMIPVPAGEYIYVGSALAERGAVSLARRLVRHATRSGGREPHAIRAAMLDRFPVAGLGTGDLLPRGEKRLFWNIDQLLDHEAVELAGVIVFRTGTRIERELAQCLERQACTQVIEKGLGANDVPGNTHLLRVEAGEAWWDALPELLGDATGAATGRTER